ncbi:glycosyltransferase family 2 protein [Geobacillus stearothermophilus]|uniref:glycosyltransferase family 2 protein n=1 Tax=Geobacillus stearothermophilus TaxID=1422 RepID=UPI003D20E44E
MKQVTDKDVAIIILNWNAYDDTFECLKSLEHLTYPYFHVFLVDNASKDGSFDKLQQDYKDGKFHIPITFIQTGANLGFAGGNNVAIREAYKQGYQYFWMLNNDTVVDSNALTSLVEVLKKDKQVVIVGSKIYYYGTDIIWFAGGRINTFTSAIRHIGQGKKDIGQYNKRKYVDYITGCSLLFRRELIDAVGYMEEDYFLYYEETDWNIRARKQGYHVMYVPESIVYHKVSVSSGGEDNRAPYVAYYDIRNGYVMIKRTQKNIFKKFAALIYMYWKSVKSFFKIILKNQDRKKERILLIKKAILDGINNRMGENA